MSELVDDFLRVAETVTKCARLICDGKDLYLRAGVLLGHHWFQMTCNIAISQAIISECDARISTARKHGYEKIGPYEVLDLLALREAAQMRLEADQNARGE